MARHRGELHPLRVRVKDLEALPFENPPDFHQPPVCNIVNTANTYNTTMAATKRIPVSEGVWAAISELKHSGQTFDDLLSRMVEQEKKRRFIEDMDRIEAEGDFVELDFDVPDTD
jgi:predicted CopG family antitoxin